MKVPGGIMATRKKATVSRAVRIKAKQVLEFAEQRARQAADFVELQNALFSPHGKATELLTTEAERTAFTRTPEYRKVLALFDRLPAPPVQDLGDLSVPLNGAITVRLPRSVHAALLAEAKAEGVSLDELCLSKLVAQLREVL
jgi:HicB family